jgi:V/A-type H+-transporting ATPase subunit D
MREVTPTRSTALDLADELRLMRQGYEFLDEKRMLLATEMLRQMRQHQAQSEVFEVEMRSAAAALAAAIERHGLDHLQAYPLPPKPSALPQPKRSVFLAVPRLDVSWPAEPPAEVAQALDPSPEAQACRAAFQRLLRLATEIGARAANLHRLAREYRRTERRAKALENVLMPEVEETIKRVDDQLDTMDREETVRTRWWSRGPAAGP